MKTQMAQTSLDIFRVSQDKFSDQEKVVYQLLLKQGGVGMTNKEIGRVLLMDASTVAGRINTLAEKHGAVVADETRECTVTGNKAKAWVIKKRV